MNKKKKTEPFYFADCHICKSMKKAEDKGENLGAEELKKIFRKANEEN